MRRLDLGKPPPGTDSSDLAERLIARAAVSGEFILPIGQISARAVIRPLDRSDVSKGVLCAPSRDRLARGCMLFVGACMEAAKLVAIFVSLFVSIFLPLIMSGKQWRAEQDRARATYG